MTIKQSAESKRRTLRKLEGWDIKRHTWENDLRNRSEAESLERDRLVFSVEPKDIQAYKFKEFDLTQNPSIKD